MYNPSRSISVLIRLGFFFFLSSCDSPGSVDSWWFCYLETPILGLGGTGYLHGLSSQYHFIFSAALTVWFCWVYLVLMRVQGSSELPGRNCPRLVRVWTLLPLDIQRTSWGRETSHWSPSHQCLFLACGARGFFRTEILKTDSWRATQLPCISVRQKALFPQGRSAFPWPDPSLDIASSFIQGRDSLPETLCLIALGDGKATRGLSWSSFESALKQCNHPTGCSPACQSLSSQPLSLAASYNEEEISGM